MSTTEVITANVWSASPWMWAAFIAAVIVMLALDLFVFGGNKSHKVSVKEAGIWSLVWVFLALLFNAGMWWHLKTHVGSDIANQKALEFFTGYLIEKSLSIDNVFVFLLIFSSLHIAAEHQRRVLIYGVIGAIVMRAMMIIAGAWVVKEFSWVLYLFGAFLVLTGIKMLMTINQKPDLSKNLIFKFAKRHLRLTETCENEQFVVWKNGQRYFTPLFLALILIELTDLVFAVDSIPAIFAITTDPFIVFTSNIFAILGLRALYFLLADVVERFHYLKYGLALVLTFIGCKMLLLPWFHMPVQLSLLVVICLIAGSIMISLLATRKTKVAS